MLQQHLQQQAQARNQAGRHRSTRASLPVEGMRVQRDGRLLHNFASNDYLALSHDPVLKQALLKAVQAQSAGSGSAHLITGHHPAHEQLEQALARWLGYEAALLFPSGFQANLGLLAGLLPASVPVLMDKLAHASLLDGARLAGARLRRFRHNDLQHAHALLQREQPWLLSTEGVFSMDGDQAPLAPLAEYCQHMETWLHVDDAHGFGVLGDGRGSVAQAGLNARQVPLLTLTFGKAMGMSGAAIMASRAAIEHIQNHSRPWIYSTATPPAWAEAGLTALQCLQQAGDRRQRLQQHVQQFQQGAGQLGLRCLPGNSPIRIVELDSNQQALDWGRKLEQAGFLVGVIRPPTSPTPRLRITLSAGHDSEQIRALLQALARVQEQGT